MLRLHDEDTRREIARRLRTARETKWKYSQEQMAEHLRGVLDPQQPTYPGLRTYARWESESEPELPATDHLINNLAEAVGFEVDDLFLPEEAPTQFYLARRFDALVENQMAMRKAIEENTEANIESSHLLRQILAALKNT